MQSFGGYNVSLGRIIHSEGTRELPPSIEELQALLAKSFTPARPIDLPEFLTGRLDVLYRAIDASNTSGKHIVLFGERGIGKTSIARVLAHNVQDAKPG
jgi:Holliday junction resolvasome RuvABC ATP-dependent DNA helicase subunit